jgi:hypothetical protein
MKKMPRRAVLDDAGRLYTLKKELDELRKERASLEERIVRHEASVAEAQEAFDASYERALAQSANGAAGADLQAPVTETLLPGKLPQRVLARMQTNPSQIFTAAELALDLGIGDVQQVRTALARLVGKELVRKTGVKGEFTL